MRFEATKPVCMALAFVLPAGSALAAEGETRRIRGTIEATDGSVLSIETREGGRLKVKLPGDAPVLGVVKAGLGDIKPGSFIGVTGRQQGERSQQALEVHIFPEAMRGSGEGFKPWDLEPKSTMTNGTVDVSVSAVSGQTLKVSYNGGEQSILVQPSTVIVTYAPGALTDLKPGVKVFIAQATEKADGSFEARRIAFGKDGLTPPM